MGPDNWDNKGNCKAGDLEAYDWVNDYWPLSHPVRVRPSENMLIDHDTGDVLAELNPKYRFYLAHGHIHICKADWDYTTYPEGWS